MNRKNPKQTKTLQQNNNYEISKTTQNDITDTTWQNKETTKNESGKKQHPTIRKIY